MSMANVHLANVFFVERFRVFKWFWFLSVFLLLFSKGNKIKKISTLPVFLVFCAVILCKEKLFWWLVVSCRIEKDNQGKWGPYLNRSGWVVQHPVSQFSSSTTWSCQLIKILSQFWGLSYRNHRLCERKQKARNIDRYRRMMRVLKVW